MADDTVQFLLRPRRELIKRLDNLAKQFRRKSGNQVAVEILEQYTDFYVLAEQAKRDVLNQQEELIRASAGGQVRKIPIVKANQDEEHTTRKRVPAGSGVGASRSRAKR